MRIILLCFFSLILNASHKLSAMPAQIILDESVDRLEVSNQIDLYLDEGKNETIDSVSKEEFDGFKRNTTLFPSFGAFPGYVWMRVTLTNPENFEVEKVLSLNAPVHDATLYERDEGGAFRSMSAGRLVVDGSEVLPNRVPAFPVRLKAGKSSTYYLRCHADMIFSIKLTLSSNSAFFQYERAAHYFAGFFVGVIIIMVLYNLFLYFTTRDEAFLWYVLTMIGLHIGIVSLNLTNNDFFGMRWPIFPDRINIIGKILGTACFVQFSRVFLHTQQSPKLDLFFKSVMATTPVFLVLLFTLPIARANALQNLALVSSIIATIIYSGMLFSRGVRYARYYFVAWLPFLLVGVITIVLNLSKNAHLLPNLHLLLAMAALAEVLLLSMALGDKINELRDEQQKAEVLYRETVLEMNRSLEQKVKEKTRDIQSMLDNLKLGIFTIDRNLKLGVDYSKHLAKLVSAQSLDSGNALQCLFDGSTVGRDQISQVETAVVSSISTDELGFLGNEHLLVREVHKNEQGRTIDLDIDWSPMIDETGGVEKLLVSMRDVTLLNSLKRESEEQKKRMEMISQYLSAPQADLKQLESALIEIQQKSITVTESRTLSKSELAASIGDLFRDMHTLKAQARRLKLSYLSDAMHAAEEHLQLVKNDKEQFEGARLKKQMDEVGRVLMSYHTVVQSLGVNRSAGGTDDQTLLLESLLMNALDERRDLALELQKPVPSVHLSVEKNFACTRSLERLLKDSLTHLVRNSLDHGLETTDERKRAGKATQGKLSVDVYTDGNDCVLEYGDDGRGLDLDRVYEKAKAKGLLNTPLDNLKAETLAHVIFESGFSTKDQTSTISGRGVGMDAIAGYMKAAGGSAGIVLGEPRNGEKFGLRSVRFILRWPRAWGEHAMAGANNSLNDAA